MMPKQPNIQFKPIPAAERYIVVHMPLAGVNVVAPFSKQPNRPIFEDLYARTCRLGVNVRGYEPNRERLRGGRRSGLIKTVLSPVVQNWVLQNLDVAVFIAHEEEEIMQVSQSGRVVLLVVVCQGNISTARPGDEVWTPALNLTGDTPPLNFDGLVWSTSLNQKMYFADGVNEVVYDPRTNQTERWEATAGTLPRDIQNNTPRIIETWRGRLALSGLLDDPENWFLSAVNDGTDFDYFPAESTPTQAIAGNTGPQGFTGDAITGFVPYTDDVLLIGGDHTLNMMSGDPGLGGTIDVISKSIGMAFGRAWCMDSYGNVYFFSNRTGIYIFRPGQQPVRISQAIEPIIQNTDTGANGIRLIWDDRAQGFHTFITPLDQPRAGVQHLFYGQRTGDWWLDEFENPNHNPLTCCTFDGNEPGDRVALIGGWDGYVRSISPEATTDDGYKIESEVTIGPILTPNLDELLLKDMQAVLGEESGDVTYSIHMGATAEQALTRAPVAQGTWKAGRNMTDLVRRAGHAFYIRITSTNTWAMESIRLRVATQGKVRGRGR